MKLWQLISFNGEMVSSFHKNDNDGKLEIIDELNNLKENYDSFSELDIDSLIENMQNVNPETSNWEAKDNIFISIEFHDLFEEM